ncbi:MAG: 5'/3'-nucleotidase SurE [Sphaerochaetaceae bacterium]|jgi:5'-nucleotidase
MLTLLTNDDGFGWPGIKILEQALLEKGHEVWVCAPDSPRSASSHSISIHKKLRFTKVDERHYHCSGTPADCLLFGLRGVLPIKPDLIISGINNGYNISTDILYSGTVSAAREGAFLGYPSIALSAQCRKDGCNYQGAADFLAESLDSFLPFCDKESFLNINVPFDFTGIWEAGALGYIDYHDKVSLVESQGNEAYYSIGGSIEPEQRCTTPSTDFQVVARGNASVTALSILPQCDWEKQERLKQLYKGFVQLS